eukprot:m.57974 g.57974  ORF g.57974 m.57974 type:complete len:184 (-) comp7845_c0_seq1:81-632(-)
MNGFGKGVYAGVSSFFLRYQAQFQPHMRNGIVVALSGGRDSVALTSILRQVYPGKLVAAIIDHGMRPESSEEAQSVALRIKEELDVETQIAKLVWNKGEKKTQASAREKRYHALLSIASRLFTLMHFILFYLLGSVFLKFGCVVSFLSFNKWFVQQIIRHNIRIVATGHHEDDVVGPFALLYL